MTQGVFEIPFSKGKVTPLKYYYSNSRGEYIAGEWIGMRGMESYYVYIENDEVKMLTDTRNRIGYSISGLNFDGPKSAIFYSKCLTLYKENVHQDLCGWSP